MTVKELIKLLKKMPQDAEVVKVNTPHAEERYKPGQIWCERPVKWVAMGTLKTKVELGGDN